MRDSVRCNHLRTTLYLLLLFISFSTGACGHSEARSTKISEDIVRQAIHDYGRGHEVSAVHPPPAIPDETDELYEAHTRVLLVRGDFAQLEKMAMQNRTEKGRVLGGNWKIPSFYDGTSFPEHSSPIVDSDFLSMIDRLKHWEDSYPESAVPHLSLAYLYISYADFGRGNGFANEVTQAQWKLYNERTAQAKAQLLLASKLKDRDPFWYQVMQMVAHHEGWDKTSARELLDQAIAFEPTYFHYYRMYARYLEPQWYGEPGDIKALAEEVSALRPEPEGSILYFQVISSLACYCKQAMEDLQSTSFAKIKEGYTNLDHLYGTSNLNANRFAFLASLVLDKPATQAAFHSLIKADLSVWTYQSTFDRAREWAASP